LIQMAALRSPWPNPWGYNQQPCYPVTLLPCYLSTLLPCHHDTLFSHKKHIFSQSSPW
jgi:hypothetical protein